MASLGGEASGEAAAADVSFAHVDGDAVDNGGGAEEDYSLPHEEDAERPRKRGRPPQGGPDGPPLFNGFKCRVRARGAAGARDAACARLPRRRRRFATLFPRRAVRPRS
jgi:hypothetical protein